MPLIIEQMKETERQLRDELNNTYQKIKEDGLVIDNLRVDIEALTNPENGAKHLKEMNEGVKKFKWLMDDIYYSKMS